MTEYCNKCGGIKWTDGWGGTTVPRLCTCPKPQPAYITGWECPRCGKIHSPFIGSCDYCNNKLWGGIVTHVEGNTYHISQGQYMINGEFIRIPEQTFEIKPPSRNE